MLDFHEKLTVFLLLISLWIFDKHCGADVVYRDNSVLRVRLELQPKPAR